MVVDGSVSTHQYVDILDKILSAIKMLSVNGTVVFNNVWPHREVEASQPKSPHAFFWLGDAWRVMLELTSYADLDLAFCDSDW